jgi:hypothetical protein
MICLHSTKDMRRTLLRCCCYVAQRRPPAWRRGLPAVPLGVEATPGLACLGLRREKQGAAVGAHEALHAAAADRMTRAAAAQHPDMEGPRIVECLLPETQHVIGAAKAARDRQHAMRCSSTLPGAGLIGPGGIGVTHALHPILRLRPPPCCHGGATCRYPCIVDCPCCIELSLRLELLAALR